MDYKYKKMQIFRKRLKVPKNILNKVYNCTLSFEEFIEYGLDDKIPISCIINSDRKIVEKFGVEKSKMLDWELINTVINYGDINFRSILLNIDTSVEDINLNLYELVKNRIKPKDYSSKMKEVYSDRLFESSEIDSKEYSYEMQKFNVGEISLQEMVRTWDLYKDKDLSYCLMNDKANVNGINDSDLKSFMTSYGAIAQLIGDNNDIYVFINEINALSSIEEKTAYVKKFTDSILSHTYSERGDYRKSIKLSDSAYREIFKYSSLEEYLNIFSENDAKKILEELKTLPQDYIFNMPIPFSVLLNYDVLVFIGVYGLKNVVDFDNECGHFFTNNNCEMLKLMNRMYLRYGGNESDPNKKIFTKNSYDESGNYVYRTYTKEEFYEAMRRMIVYGPSDFNYKDKAPDYRNITGEFRKINAELYISEQAPDELQKLFYTKSITPQLLVKHPEYIQYLDGKDLESCFKSIQIKVESKDALYNYVNFYKFISFKKNFTETMKFITEYSDLFDIVFDMSSFADYQYEIKFSEEDSISEFQGKINDAFKRRIIEKRIVYPKNVPQNFIADNPTMFLSSDAPKELQEAFYNRTITSDFILSNPVYKNYLKNIDLEILYNYTPVSVVSENIRIGSVNLISAIKQSFGENDSFDLMLLYGKYIDRVFEANQFQKFRYSSNFSKDDLLDEIDLNILNIIIDGKIKYDESMPTHFKNNNPTLFLNKNVPQDIRDKFYNREFTLNDFVLNPNLLEILGDTNVVCGFSEDIAWMIPLFNNFDNLKKANYNRLKVISAYSKINDVALQNSFKEYIMELGNEIEIEKIEYVSVILSRLSLSNSSEIFTFRKELATQILKSSNPLESLNKIEDIFIRNNIPTVGKIYSCFEILHPDFEGFNFTTSMVSPMLKKSSTRSKKIIVFSDLIKASFGSNNRSVISYLNNIEVGSNLYENIRNGRIHYDELSEFDRNELITFSKHLATLYNNTLKGKKESQPFTFTGNVLTDILELSKRLSPNGTLDYNIADRVIRMFCGFSGIDTLDQAKEYVSKKVQYANARNRNASVTDMTLEQGDFIKGIGDITYLRNILQNGSVSKEFLGSSAGSDLTPLDTDLSIIMSSDGTTRDKIDLTAARSYGPIWFVLKNDDRFVTTRTREETIDTKRDTSKMEVFYTGAIGAGHYGIRTGFASSEINYIVMEKYDSRVGLEIAMNGFYIPVANKDGVIVFTPDDYDKLREKMSGLSYFGENNYMFSSNLVTVETEYLASLIEKSNHEVKVKRTKIYEIIKQSIAELGLQLKTTIEGDLTEGVVELIDTGSTGRGTNKPGDGDFDFMMRLDKTILSNPSKLSQLKKVILKNLGKENSIELTGTGDFRLKNVQIDSEVTVDIDITFTEKTSKVSYSTDMALQDRLTTIQKNDPEKYKYVVANILLAKQVLKQASAYKPNRGEMPQGGLGGVGIENWILQNGGSFIDAAKSFVKAAEGKSFAEFKSSYQIWDFGDNHLAERRGHYPHDNFVLNNMSEAGYLKMVQTLNEYLKTIETEIENIRR